MDKPMMRAAMTASISEVLEQMFETPRHARQVII